MPFLFERLAGELRNKVYDIIIKSFDGSITSSYHTIRKEALPLAHVSQQLRKEYLSRLLSYKSLYTKWNDFDKPIVREFFTTGNTNAKPGRVLVYLSVLDRHARVEIVALAWHSERIPLIHNREDAIRANDTVGGEKLAALCMGLRTVIDTVRSPVLAFQSSIKDRAVSVGAFKHIYIDRGRKAETSENGEGSAEQIGPPVVLKVPWQALTRAEWHVLVKVYSTLSRLPGVKMNMEEVDGMVRRYVCRSDNGMRLDPGLRAHVLMLSFEKKSMGRRT
ncbi:hypothetical protein BU23DRAFT_629690 [Bimuria novae-zelandiae CBS 107.79]|uniref:Uncharacterized protein n=1 Tax=Bimuria novae-zelandiae CBS 107.79 TaxID=1447943 RepID=A0A6A5VIA1_9PLEO|nr:hypothetical protein BU23DRAFT_629690 [Bimuria novae-zelandiae CBS 107.79]